jgi:sulfur-carrier protein
VLDEQGAVRPHMVVFVDGRQVRDRQQLSDPVPRDGEIYVAQALSGG